MGKGERDEKLNENILNLEDEVPKDIYPCGEGR